MQTKRGLYFSLCLVLCFLMLMPQNVAKADTDTEALAQPLSYSITLKDQQNRPHDIKDVSTDADNPTVARSSLSFTSANFEFDNTLSAGDVLRLGLKPTEPEFVEFAFVYTSTQSKFQTVVDKAGKTIADITFINSATEIKLTFNENVNDSDKTTVEFRDLDFSVDTREVAKWFSAHQDDPRIQRDASGDEYVDVRYNVRVNDEIVNDTTYYVRFYKARYVVPTFKTAKKYGGYSSGNMTYVVEFHSDLQNTNEFVLFDTPDVNQELLGQIEVKKESAAGQPYETAFYINTYEMGRTGSGYFNVTKNSFNLNDANKDDVQVYAYDIYVKATREGMERSRQASYGMQTLDITHFDPRRDGNVSLSAPYNKSIKETAAPEDILLVKPIGTKLTAEEQAMIDAVSIDGASGLTTAGKSGAVVKGFKLVIQNLPRNISGHQFYALQYNMKILNEDIPFRTSQNEPKYWNTAAYYFQEIPTCSPEDENCVPVRANAATIDDVYRETPGNALTNEDIIPKGSVIGSTEQSEGSVVVKYRLAGTTSDWLRAPELLRGKIGTAFDISAADAKSRYMPDELTYNSETYRYVQLASGDGLSGVAGNFTETTQTIILEYEKKPAPVPAKLTVRYRLEGTEDTWLKSDTELVGYAGEAYDLTDDAHRATYMPETIQKDAQNYQFVQVAKGAGLAAASGELTDNALVILDYKLTEVTPVPVPDPEPDPKPDPNPKPQPDPNPDPKPDPNPKPQPDPNPEPDPDSKPNPKPEPEPKPNPDPEVNPVPSPDPEVQPNLDPNPESKPAPDPDSNPTPTPEPELDEGLSLTQTSSSHAGQSAELQQDKSALPNTADSFTLVWAVALASAVVGFVLICISRRSVK